MYELLANPIVQVKVRQVNGFIKKRQHQNYTYCNNSSNRKANRQNMFIKTLTVIIWFQQ